jgi:hypothetical protein
MFFIPGYLVAALTFPGIMVHEWAHKFFCDRFGVRVFEVKYFQFDYVLAGYVNHEPPKTFWQSFGISFGPVVINTAAAILVAILSTQALPKSWFEYGLIWLSISIGMHAFPSTTDADNVLDMAKRLRANGGSIFLLLMYPLVGLIWMANGLKLFWFDVLYAVIVYFVGETIGTGGRWF